MFGSFRIDNEVIVETFECDTFMSAEGRIRSERSIPIKVCELKGKQYLAGNDTFRVYITTTDKQEILNLFSSRLICDYFLCSKGMKSTFGIPEDARLLYLREFKEVTE
jgi:hypothetical protein